MIKKWFFIFLSGALLNGASAQKIETLVKEISLKTDDKALAQKSALDEISQELVKEMVGADKYQKEKQKIVKYIIKGRNRYILSVQISSGVLQDDGAFSFTVTAQVSRENLKNLLLNHNLFYTSEGSFCLLPAISFSSYFEEKKKSYSWFKKKSSETADPLLKQMATAFFKLLSGELIKQGFYVLDPVFQRIDEGAPSFVLPKKVTRAKHFASLSEFYNCDLILLGHIQTGSSADLIGQGSLSSSYQTQFSFNVFNIKTRQFLFKLKKQFPFSPALMKDPVKELLLRSKDVLNSLSYQLAFYQEEGVLELNRMIISIQGALTYAEAERLKKALVENISGIQSLEERFLSSGRWLYLAESSKSMTSIIKELKKARLPGFAIQVKGFKKRKMEIYAKTL